MLLLSSLGLLPMASASPPTITLHFAEVFVGGAKAGPGTTLKVGDEYSIGFSATVDAEPCTTGVAGATRQMRIGAFADLRAFNGNATQWMGITNTTINTAPSTAYTITGNHTFIVGPSSTGRDGALIRPNFVLQATCVLVNAVGQPISEEPAATPATPTNNEVTLDNTPPSLDGNSVTATLVSGTGGIGSTFTLGIPVHPSRIDVTSFEFGLHQAQSNHPSNGTMTNQSVGSSVTVTVTETGFDTPVLYVNVSDANGNKVAVPVSMGSLTLDARAPLTPSNIAIAPQTNGNVVITLDANHNDVVQHRVNVTGPNGSGRDFLCPGAECVSTAITRLELTNASGFFTSSKSYTFTLRAEDEKGNIGPASTPHIRETLPNFGASEVAITLNGPPRIGTPLTIETRSLSADVRRIDVDISKVSTLASPLVLTPGQTASITVEDTGQQAATLTALLYGPDASTSPAPVRDATTGAPLAAIDARAPSAVTGLQVAARRGGFVELFFVPAAGDTDVNAYDISYNQAGMTASTTRVAHRTDGTYNMSQALFTKGARYFFNISAVDSSGNVGAVAPTLPAVLSTVPNDDPASITLAPFTTTRANVPTFSGTFNPPEALATHPYANLAAFLRNAAGDYYSGTGTTFAATPTYFPLDSRASPAFTASNFTGLALPNGAYTIGVRLVNMTPTAESTVDFVLDMANPVITSATFFDPSAGVLQGTGPVSLRLQLSDAPSGFGSLTVQLLQTTTGNPPASAIGGGNVIVTCPGAGCSLSPATPFVGATSFDGWANVTLPSAPVGTYTVRITLTDAAGNAVSVIPVGSIRIGPRVGFAQDSDTPFAFPDGVAFRVYAAYDGTSSVQPAQSSCPESVCRVTSVEVRARPLTGTGSTGPGVVILNTTIPNAGPDFSFDSSRRYYNYTPPTRINVTDVSSTLDVNNLQLRATAWVRLPDGNLTNGTMPSWVRVRTGDAPAGILINKPTEWAVNMTGAPGSVHFNVTFDQQGISGFPIVNYTLRNLANGTYVRIDQASGPIFSATPPATPVVRNVTYPAPLMPPTSGVYNYSWFNNATLPRGEYVMNASVRSPDGLTLIKWAERRFAVESVRPTVTFNLADSQITPSSSPSVGFVSRSFIASVLIQHGYANVTGASITPVLEQNSPTAPWIANNTGGFSATLENLTAIDNENTSMRFRVVLPDGNDGTRYDLRFNVTTDASLTGAGSNATGTGFTTVILDKAPPTATVDLLNTNASGRTLGAPLFITGFGQDSGSGISSVEVRLYNLSSGSTFRWDLTYGGIFLLGEQDTWMSSEVRRVNGSVADYQRDIYLDPTPVSPGLYRWTLHAANRAVLTADGTPNGTKKFDDLSLDRYSEYRVEVRVRDKVGLVSGIETYTVRFDDMAPELLDATKSGSLAQGVSTVNWHTRVSASNDSLSDVVFATNVRDNVCVKDVRLVGLAPSGATVKASFARPSGAVCTATSGNTAANWTVNLRNHPQMTDEIGEYSYWVEVEDFSGHVNATPTSLRTFKVTVRDVLPATVQAAYFVPDKAQVGGSAVFFVEILENQGVDRIEVDMYLTLSPTHRTFLGTARMTPSTDPRLAPAANGTGWYTIDTSTGWPDVELEVGNYLFVARPRDTAGTGCSTAACNEQAHSPRILTVVADGAPAVTREAPFEGAPFVNATPILTFRVDDPSIATVQLRVGGSDATLQAVTHTLVNITNAAGNVTGARVSYQANATSFGGNLTYRLTVTDASGFATVVNDTIPVDAVAPTLDVTVSGTVVAANRTYAVPGTFVNATAQDDLAGLASLSYRENGGVARGYTGSVLPAQSSAPDGEYVLTFIARDNASNEATRTVELFLDRTGPTITVSNEGSIFEEVLVSVIDAGVGTNESVVYLRYAMGEEPIFANLSFAKVSGNLYRAALPSNASENGMRYYVEARDLMGNLGNKCSAAVPCVVRKAADETPSNAAPVLTITAPVNGTAINTTVELRWSATDADSDAIQITIALRRPDGPGEVLVTLGENSGAYSLPVATFTPGEYALIVTATDGTDTTQREVSFRVPAPATPTAVRVVQALPTSANEGTAVSFTVSFATSGRAISSATFKVLRDGEQVGNGTLTPLATGLRGQFTPEGAGKYSILVTGTLVDGSTVPETSVGEFDVQGSASPASAGFPTSLITLLVLGLLTIALAAYAAFVRWGK